MDKTVADEDDFFSLSPSLSLSLQIFWQISNRYKITRNLENPGPKLITALDEAVSRISLVWFFLKQEKMIKATTLTFCVFVRTVISTRAFKR
jgi:hypothetical protein